MNRLPSVLPSNFLIPPGKYSIGDHWEGKGNPQQEIGMLRLKESLSKPDYEIYSQSTSLYLCGKISKTEFDYVMSRCLNTPERLAWHNEHILAIEASIIDYHQRELQQGDEQTGNASPSWKVGDIKLTSGEQKLVTEASKRPRLCAIPQPPIPITPPEEMSQEEYARIMCPSTDTGHLPSSQTWMERIKLCCQNAALTPPLDDIPARLLWLVTRSLK